MTMNDNKRTIASAIFYGEYELIETLIKNGGDINETCNDGKSLLHQAVELLDINAIKILIKHGADINKCDKFGQTVLHQAIISMKFADNIDIVECLITNGVNINHVDMHERNALFYALYRNSNISIIEMLLKYNANINQIDIYGNNVLLHAINVNATTNIIGLLINCGVDINHKNKDTHPYLPLAVGVFLTINHRRFRNEQVPILLAAGADHTGLDIKIKKYSVKISLSEKSLGEKSLRFPKKNIELAGFNAIRKRAGTICIALQDLDLPAPQTIEIIVQACVPFAENLPYHYLWDLVVMVKHFHDRQSKKMSEKKMSEKEMI
jgi:ankyrin repeat protein